MSLDALTGTVTGRSLVAVVLSYAVCPYAVLWLAVRLWPKGQPRRDELLAEYDSVDWWMRPLWVGDVAIRCLLGGLSERARRARLAVPAVRVALSRAIRVPNWLMVGSVAGGVGSSLVGQWWAETAVEEVAVYVAWILALLLVERWSSARSFNRWLREPGGPEVEAEDDP